MHGDDILGASIGDPDGPIEPIAPLEQPAPAKPPAMLPVQPCAPVPPVQPTPPRASTESTPPEQPATPASATPGDELERKGGWLTIVAIAIGVIIALAIIGTMLGACGSDGEDPAPTLAATVDDSPVVELTLDAERTGETVSFSGTTNLPDGAVLTYVMEYDTGDGHGRTPFESTGLVQDGRFEGEGEAGSPAELRVVFQMHLDPDRQQPADLIERYGALGEKMDGDHVVDGPSWWDTDPPGQHAEIVATVE